MLAKLTADRPYSDPETAARRLLGHAHAFEPIQEGRIYIEKLNGPFLFGDRGTPAEYAAGLDHAISVGWLELHDSGTFVKQRGIVCLIGRGLSGSMIRS